MKTHAWSSALLTLLVTARADHPLPYNPTRIFVSPNNSLVYRFQHSGYNGVLSTVSLAKSLDATNMEFEMVSFPLPFLSNDKPLPYTPTLDANGNITVVTGDCSQGAQGTQVWRFEPDPSSSSGEGTWSKYDGLGEQLNTDSAEAGAQYLSNSVTYSAIVTGEYSDADVYVFGGMCPSENSTPATWISDASYSNLMLSLAPDEADASFKGFNLGIVPNTGPPIAQAGSSLTALRPTYAISTSSAPTFQQQNFVLIGGHTENAFINMSQLAIFSLPKQSWNFVSAQQPSEPHTDLALKQRSDHVTPRSGHTAVMSEDGTSIVIYGGWVGDVNTPADPLMAILEVGSGFGGSGDWKWTVPQQTGSGLPPGTGLYGHGAAMLPGGVMMITGGYEISGPSSRKSRRNAHTTNENTFFYNVTSQSWANTYTATPGELTQTNNEPASHSDNARTIGLSVGLVVGAALLLIATAFYVWYKKQLKYRREQRQRALMTYSSDGAASSRYNQGTSYSRDGFGVHDGDLRTFPSCRVSDEPPSEEYPRPPEMQHTTGMFVNVPSPTRGLRRGFGGKAYQYHQAPRADEARHSHGSRDIHTITENVDEDDGDEETRSRASGHEQLNDAERKLREVERVLHSDYPFNPFRDPEPNPLGSHPVVLLPGRDSSQNMTSLMNWMTIPPTRKPVPNAADGHSRRSTYGDEDFMDEVDGGRISPHKTYLDRTASIMSGESRASIHSMARTVSTRTTALLAAAHAGTRYPRSNDGAMSPTEERTHTMSSSNTGHRSPRPHHARSSTGGSPTRLIGPRGNDTDSWTTAQSDFLHLQSEGEALLGGVGMLDRDGPYHRALAVPMSRNAQPPQIVVSSAPTGMIRSRKPGWVGNLRRALNAVSSGEYRSFSLTGSRDRYTDGEPSGSTGPSSPSKDRVLSPLLEGGTPRRALSDGSALLRQKRGRTDWEDNKAWPAYHDSIDPAGGAGEGMEEDWDVEGAAAKRDVQVLFTVPKSRLRVVNDDMDRASLRSASDGALSRSGSLKKTSGLEDSIRSLRLRSEGDRSAAGLSVMEEEGMDWDDDVARLTKEVMGIL